MSLLKRLEQGQGTTPDPKGKAASLPDPADKKVAQAGTLSTLTGRSGLASTPEQRNPTADIKSRVQNKLINDLNPSMDLTKTDELKKNILQSFEQILNEENIILSRPERQKMFEQILAEILGFGPMQSVLDDESVTEVMVNGPKNVYVERKGRLMKVPISFENNDHVKRVIDRIVSPLGRRIDESSPYVDARLPDGSRVNAVIPPISLIGPTITIRKFSKTPITIQQMVNFGSITAEAVEFLKACVFARCNIVISGGTGSGKTTLLNVLSGFIPPDERILTIENAAELQLRQEHVVTLESRPMNIEGKGEITIRQLVVNALRMRPDRIVVGEIRDEAALDMLQAMNTGHDGSMTTLHSNSPRDTLSRLETMTLMAGMDLPVRAIREQISSAVNLICHQERMRDGTRKITHITEVLGMEGDVITTTDIFIFEQTGLENGKIIGQLRPTGLRPRFLDRIESAGVQLPNSVFGINSSRRH